MFASDRPLRQPAPRGGWAMRRFVLAAVAIALVAVAVWPALAQQAASREQEQIRRLRQQVQQLQAELSKQSQAQAQAAQQAAAQQARADVAAAAQQRTQASLAARVKAAQGAQQQLVELQAEQARLQSELANVKAQSQATSAELQAARTEQLRLRQSITTGAADLADMDARRRLQAGDLRACVLQRQALDDLAAELLSRLGQRSALAAVVEDEPFLQFGRVQQQNVLQGYEARLRALRLTAAPGEQQR
jgi:chromosome segregation ATPase